MREFKLARVSRSGPPSSPTTIAPELVACDDDVDMALPSSAFSNVAAGRIIERELPINSLGSEQLTESKFRAQARR